MYLKEVIVIIGTCLLPLALGSCEKKGPCRCEYGDGAVVDLSSLDQNSGNPLFMDIQDNQQQDMFSWNPCSDFTESSCSGVAACQIRPELPNAAYYSLGSQDSATFVEKDGNLAIQYTGVQDGVTRIGVVTLTCIDSGPDAFSAGGEQGTSATYEMELKSVHACKSGGISPGTILIIIFVSLVAVYLLVGIPYQIFVKKERGKRVIPLLDFWISVPALAKDGVMLIVTRGKRSGYQSA